MSAFLEKSLEWISANGLAKLGWGEGSISSGTGWAGRPFLASKVEAWQGSVSVVPFGTCLDPSEARGEMCRFPGVFLHLRMPF